MPDMTNVPPGVPPEDYASFINAQRQQMLANALMSGAITPPEQPQTQPVKGLYYQPRTGAVPAVAKIAEALMGRSASNKAIQSQAALAQQLNQSYAPGGQQTSPGIPLQAAPAPSDPNSQDVQPAIARLPGASLAQTVQATQPTFSAANPRNPQGLPADVVRNLAMYDPKSYAAMLQGPESVQLARLGNIDPGTAARAALSKSTQTEVRPGQTVMDPISGRTVMGADPSKGEYYAIGPNGQVQAFPITNDATLQAWRAGLTTAAQQANTPRDVPMGGGRTALGYPPTPPALRNPQGPLPATATAPGSVPPQNAPAPSAAPAAGPAPGASPGAAAPVAGTPRPPGPAPQAAPAQQPAPSGAWSTIPKLTVPTTPGVSSDARTMGQIANANSKDKELSDKYGEAATLANQQLDFNRRALQALPNAEVGPMSEFLTTNRQRLIELGVPQSLIPSSGTVTPTLELNKELLNAALQGARSIYGSRMTQNEVKLQTEEMSPSSHMTADAINSLIQQSNVQASYAKQQAADYAKYTRMGGDPMQFEQWYSTNRPLTRYAAASTTPPAALQRLQQNPSLLPDFKTKYGWDPSQ